MLKFYGIRFNQNGTPERFSLSFALSESLHAGLKLSELLNGDPLGTAKAVDDEINRLFQCPETKRNSKQFRFLVARWFRTKDIVQFLFTNQESTLLKIEICRVLDAGDSIKNKWKKIEKLLLDYLAKLEAGEKNEQLSNPESDIGLILQMVSLFFMEQDDELPPANLELQFIRYQFPRIIWKKKDGFNAASNPFWLPQNMYCRSSYLLARLISRIYEKTGTSFETFQSESNKAIREVPLKSQVQLRTVPNAVSLKSLLPDNPPDELQLILQKSPEDNEQLCLIPETVSETLLSLQKTIQKKLSHDGVKHLLGILRQFASASSDGFCSFDIQSHLKLIARESKQGSFSEKQVSLFNETFNILSKIKVKRIWNEPGKERESENHFVLECYTESKKNEVVPSVKKLVLDPLFLPARNNPFHLGGHLRLIPPRLFRESTQKHALLPGIASYLTGTWLNEYAVNRGIATKSTRQIIEGCAFNVTPATRYRIVDKVNSELAYMKEKCYISDYRHQKSEDGNPWDDLHSITASENVLASLAEKMRAVDANCISEKLIA